MLVHKSNTKRRHFVQVILVQHLAIAHICMAQDERINEWKRNEWMVSCHLAHIQAKLGQEKLLNEVGEMNPMTLSSKHTWFGTQILSIRITSTLLLGHRGSPQHQIVTSERERNIWLRTRCQSRERMLELQFYRQTVLTITPRLSALVLLNCKAKRRYPLICKVSIYCFLVLHGSIGLYRRKMVTYWPVIIARGRHSPVTNTSDQPHRKQRIGM